MATYGEIINPSDKYTICVDDSLAACVAVLLIGGGQYTLKCEPQGWRMPMLALGGHEEWWALQENDGLDLSAWLAANGERIATALESVVIGDRDEYEAMLAELPSSETEAFRSAWRGKHITSLNDIGARAKSLAERTRKTLADKKGGKA